MKILLTLFALLFSSSVLAEDLSDFQIEGMSIGDSLLEYFSEKEILSNRKFYNKEDEFITSEFYKNIQSNEYDSIGVYYKSNDKKFIIHAISGIVFYNNNIEDCYSKKNIIIEDLSNLLKNIEWKNYE